MRTRARWITSAVVATVLVATLGVWLALRNGAEPESPAPLLASREADSPKTTATVAPPKELVTTPQEVQAVQDAPVPSQPEPVAEVVEAAPEERPIEEILAEAGEDPGAVFYTSRVREALKEGNPKFARELLRQMHELHGRSVLIDEAEALFVER